MAALTLRMQTNHNGLKMYFGLTVLLSAYFYSPFTVGQLLSFHSTVNAREIQ